jgi:hypothetical protein
MRRAWTLRIIVGILEMRSPTDVTGGGYPKTNEGWCVEDDDFLDLRPG